MFEYNFKCQFSEAANFSNESSLSINFLRLKLQKNSKKLAIKVVNIIICIQSKYRLQNSITKKKEKLVTK